MVPVTSPVSGYKLKYYEFAGKFVGKCLLDSSYSDETKQYVVAKFARSFLAQLIGLPVTYSVSSALVLKRIHVSRAFIDSFCAGPLSALVP